MKKKSCKEDDQCISEMETHQASPNLKKFFNNLASLKEMIQDQYEETGDKFLGIVLKEFQRIYKPEKVEFEED